MALSNGKGASRTDSETSAQNLGSEIAAVQSAASRLFESTADYPNDSFVHVLDSLCSLIRRKVVPASTPKVGTGSFRTPVLHQRRVGSVSGISLSTESDARDYVFALNKIADLVSLNESRLAIYDATESGWNIMMTELVSTCINKEIASSARLLAADIIARTVKDIAGLSLAEPGEHSGDVQGRLLSALQYQITALYEGKAGDEELVDETDIEVHYIALEALKAVMEQCGELLTAGWDSVFAVLGSAFQIRRPAPNSEEDLESTNGITTKLSLQPSRVISKRLARSAFGSAHLVCSDFLAAVPDSSVSTLLELLILFCSQHDDMNMSLTVSDPSSPLDTVADLRRLSRSSGTSRISFTIESICRPYLVWSATTKQGRMYTASSRKPLNTDLFPRSGYKSCFILSQLPPTTVWK
jgi:hypothetical protein